VTEKLTEANYNEEKKNREILEKLWNTPGKEFASLSSGERAFYEFICKISPDNVNIAIHAFPRFWNRLKNVVM